MARSDGTSSRKFFPVGFLCRCSIIVALLRQALSGSGDGGVKTAARLRLALVSVVVARWSSDLIIIFITFGILCTAVDDN
jgi:hypothetical protein